MMTFPENYAVKISNSLEVGIIYVREKGIIRK